MSVHAMSGKITTDKIVSYHLSFALTAQLGDLKSHNRIDLSIAPEIKVSSIGDMHSDTTLLKL